MPGQQRKGPGPRKVRPESVEAAEKRAKGLRLLKAGVDNWDEIARQCGWANRGTAYAEVTKELRAIPQIEADQLRSLIHMRHEALIMANWSRALGGDAFAGRLVLDILAAERKVFGLDAPVVTRVYEYDGDAADSTIAELEAEVQRRAIAAGEDHGVPREAPTDP